MDHRNNFNRLAYFVATIEAGTITGAALTLGISKAVVSKQLQLLEDEVGTLLLSRNTRHLQPTEAGLAFYEDAKSALTQANNAYERVQQKHSEPRGLLRIAAPVDYGIAFVAPFAARFREIYPEVTIDLTLDDERTNIIEGRFDLTFRVGWLSDSSNLARRLLDFEEIAVCAPATFQKAGVRSPADLSALPFVSSKALAGKRVWEFTKGDISEVAQPVTVAEISNTLAIRAFVTESYSYTIMPDFMLREDIAQGRLKRLVPDWSQRRGGVYTVTPPGRVRSNALQKFIDLAHRQKGVFVR